MKNLIFTIAFIFLLVGCGQKEVAPTEQPSTTKMGDVADYFPILPDVYYEYNIVGLPNGDSTRTIYNGYVNGNKTQRYINSPAITGSSVEIIESSKDEVRFLYGDPSFYFFENITNADPNVNTVILKKPIKEGTTWADKKLKVTNTITGVSVPIDTPSGKYDTLEVTVKLENGDEEKYYYAKDVGIVKSVHQSNGGEITVTLSSIQKNQAVLIPSKFYFLNTTLGKIEEIPRDLAMKTNDNFVKQLEGNMKKSPSEEYEQILPEGVTIDSIIIDRTNATATIDFANDFPTDSSLGDGVQAVVVQCIADTVGNFYDVDKVALTIGGNDFKSGDIALIKGDYLTVKDSSEYAKEKLQ